MQLSTCRLELRDAEDTDIPRLSAYQSDSRYLEHYEVKPDAGDIIAQAKSWALENPRLNYQLIVTRVEDSAVIGCAGIRTEGYAKSKGEIGIELNPDYWGEGYASEVVRKLIEFSKSIGVSELYATTASTNKRAYRLLTGHGFSQTNANGSQISLHCDLESPV